MINFEHGMSGERVVSLRGLLYLFPYFFSLVLFKRTFNNQGICVRVYLSGWKQLLKICLK